MRAAGIPKLGASAPRFDAGSLVALRLAVAAGLALPSAGALAADGAALFEANCAACHSAAGVGTPGLAPPVAGTETFGKLGPDAPEYLAAVMIAGLSGKIVVGGIPYVGAMPSQDALPDADLAAIATYVLKDLNGLAAPDPSLIAATRAARPSPSAVMAMRKTAMGD